MVKHRFSVNSGRLSNERFSHFANFDILLFYPLSGMLICVPNRTCFQKHAAFGGRALTKYHQTEGCIDYMYTG
jgi:hypothetical protein